jgi:hypothetical protein
VELGSEATGARPVRLPAYGPAVVVVVVVGGGAAVVVVEGDSVVVVVDGGTAVVVVEGGCVVVVVEGGTVVVVVGDGSAGVGSEPIGGTTPTPAPEAVSVGFDFAGVVVVEGGTVAAGALIGVTGSCSPAIVELGGFSALVLALAGAGGLDETRLKARNAAKPVRQTPAAKSQRWRRSPRGTGADALWPSCAALVVTGTSLIVW